VRWNPLTSESRMLPVPAACADARNGAHRRVEQLSDEPRSDSTAGQVILEPGHSEDEVTVRVSPEIAADLRGQLHQAGIRFGCSGAHLGHIRVGTAQHPLTPRGSGWAGDQGSRGGRAGSGRAWFALGERVSHRGPTDYLRDDDPGEWGLPRTPGVERRWLRCSFRLPIGASSA
jgi:hypothetical protein